jgi:Fe-S-cluster containining protein
MSDTNDTNPCLACGACCKSYRVSFYWADAEQRGLPASLTEQLNPYLACMAGTNAREPRCAALRQSGDGTFACGVYERRPDPSREVQIGDGKCVQARRRHGLPALPPDANLLR